MNYEVRPILLLIVLCCVVGCGARKLVAVGDLHGDLNQTLSVLRLVGVIDDKKHWVGGDTILVQLGDVLDVGPEDIDIVKLFMKLTDEAKRDGGGVEQLLGNHELRNLRGDFSAANPTSLNISGGEVGRNQLLSMDNSLGAYLRTRNAIFHHGKYLFMHGGFSTSTAKSITGLDKVESFNSELRRALVSGEIGPLAATGMSLDESVVDDVRNPILVRSILNVKCSKLKEVLEKHFPGIETVVVGHVPHNPRSFEEWQLCGGALIDIDFGMSTWKSGTAGSVAALEIYESNQTAVLVQSDTVELPQWKADEDESKEYHSYGVVVWATAAGVVFFIASVLTIGLCREQTARKVDSVETGNTYGTF